MLHPFSMLMCCCRHEPDSGKLNCLISLILKSCLSFCVFKGLLITLGQFIIVALSAYPSQSSASPPFFLKKTKIPFRKLFFSSFMFFSVNMLNNWAFAFNISVPVHIILRSFGSVTTMAAGWLRGKRYTQLQVLSVVVLTAGVMTSAWADAASKVHIFNKHPGSQLLIVHSGQTSRRKNRLYRAIFRTRTLSSTGGSNSVILHGCLRPRRIRRARNSLG
jgi:hypothetical protein